jgi:hypothetical protein
VLAIAPNTQVNTNTVAVTITGQDFQAGCSVWLDGVGLGVSSCAPNTVLASVPLDMVAGYYDLTVTNPDAQFDTLTNAYTATNPIPVVTAITQSLSVSTITDLTVTITGNYFRDTGSPGNLRANLAEETPISLTNVTYVNSTTLTAEVPFASPGVPLGVYTLTVTNPGPTDPSGSLVEAFSVFTYTTVITCNGAVANCGGADGSPDGSWAEIDPGEEIIFDFGAANGITDGPGYDLVFFEHPNAPGIFLDFITIELSPDGSAWTPVLEWDGVGVTTNTNIDSYSTDAGGEEDNEVIDGADLLSGGLPLNTGVAMDIALLPPGAYRYVRITDPGGGTPEPAEVDALLRLH